MQKIVKNQDILEIVLLSGHFEPFSSHFCHTQKKSEVSTKTSHGQNYVC